MRGRVGSKDRDYKVPEGFEPVLNYYDDARGVSTNEGIPVVGVCKLLGVGKYGRDVEFEIGEPPDHVPALPLAAVGELWHRGWDIPTQWVIDAVGQCWKDGAHGGALYPVESGRLLDEAERQADRNYIRGLLGMQPEEPEWMAAARAAGWKPAHRDAFCEGVAMLMKIDAMEDEGTSQTPAANRIRDRWCDLAESQTDEEQNLIDELSAALRQKEIDKDLVKEVVWRLSTTWFDF